jgi:hypothetical protein
MRNSNDDTVLLAVLRHVRHRQNKHKLDNQESRDIFSLDFVHLNKKQLLHNMTPRRKFCCTSTDIDGWLYVLAIDVDERWVKGKKIYG